VSGGGEREREREREERERERQRESIGRKVGDSVIWPDERPQRDGEGESELCMDREAKAG